MVRRTSEFLGKPYQRVRALLIALVFVLFVFNAVGVTDIRLIFDGGVAFNPHIIEQLVDGQVFGPLLRPDFLIFFAVGAVLAFALPLLTPISASLLTLGCMIPPIYIAWIWPVPAPSIPFEFTLLAILVLYSVNVLSSYFIETHQRQKIVSAFGQYVPPLVVEQISKSPDAFSMQGEARDLSVLFCDIKGFSTISEQLAPIDLAAMLNAYLTAMTNVLQLHGATIDKYIGDAIMAFWGAPLKQPDHAQRAVRAALAMQQRMAQLRDSFPTHGWPSLYAGIGLTSGVMNVGNMGSRYRIAYTVLGDEVNLSARLEALTRLYGVDILVSESTRLAATTGDFREIDHVRVRGKGLATRIYQPLLSTPVDDSERQRQDRALAAYYAGDWSNAEQQFSQLSSDFPDCRWSRVFLERVRSHRCPEGWDGVVSFHDELSYSIAPGEVA